MLLQFSLFLKNLYLFQTNEELAENWCLLFLQQLPAAHWQFIGQIKINWADADIANITWVIVMVKQ